MEHQARRTGNTPWAARVVSVVALDGTEPLATDDQEDPTTTTLMAPNTMAHLEQYSDAEWVEPSDERTVIVHRFSSSLWASLLSFAQLRTMLAVGTASTL